MKTNVPPLTPTTPSDEPSAEQRQADEFERLLSASSIGSAAARSRQAQTPRHVLRRFGTVSRETEAARSEPDLDVLVYQLVQTQNPQHTSNASSTLAEGLARDLRRVHELRFKHRPAPPRMWQLDPGPSYLLFADTFDDTYFWSQLASNSNRLLHWLVDLDAVRHIRPQVAYDIVIAALEMPQPPHVVRLACLSILEDSEDTAGRMASTVAGWLRPLEQAVIPVAAPTRCPSETASLGLLEVYRQSRISWPGSTEPDPCSLLTSMRNETWLRLRTRISVLYGAHTQAVSATLNLDMARSRALEAQARGDEQARTGRLLELGEQFHLLLHRNPEAAPLLTEVLLENSHYYQDSAPPMPWVHVAPAGRSLPDERSGTRRWASWRRGFIRRWLTTRQHPQQAMD